MNPPREEFESMDQDGEEFRLSQGYNSADDSFEMFSSSDDGNENFPGNYVDEFLNYVENDDSGDNIPPNGDETTSTKDNGMMKSLQENIVTKSRSRPFHINPKHSSYTRVRTNFSQK